MAKIVECVPNYSEGRDLAKIEKIVAPFKEDTRIELLGVEPDGDYNRTVVTVMGEPEIVAEAVIRSIGIAAEVIDMNVHRGEHKRMGATDVVPFIPIKDMTVEECNELSKKVGKAVWERYQVPIFLYENTASAPNRVSLPDIRKGEYEGMKEKMLLPEWAPDFGERAPHPTAGVTAVGCRMPLIAFNINLDTADVEIAKKIAKAIRFSSGGFRYIQAGPAEIKEKGFVQVTMNIKDFKKNPIYRVFETVKMEAKRYGVNVTGSEIIGAVPMEAIVESLAYYLGVEDLGMNKILESKLMK
ncbi:glutamate formimidoyltransferase [Fusobacterium necrophorum]|uniref:glutamate formimidoyltransferase n=1 Tax=Fusobacterium necrophorum TaxID=859 RepID=UPI0004614F8F|nr:glutamate formimidoyltransferase [Fusobacterium necrophorum]KDE70473.1 glutamate formiminotransferase [Fusobacterium necrophorum DAB]KYM44966.1 glutamate formiminotransferase [Fusobacterium necrophorum subsp. funduliforme]MBR8722440.1 Glutamate formimidoyltransferase [Fusobacterium necrophorum subsp. funduliforme]MDK4485142.1 glutamate formimidoyltransferase [Fusobacterium necrophorum]MDK4501250.1 glutamate formimidoyltransferase [Fusobacterium necrophorum]